MNNEHGIFEPCDLGMVYGVEGLLKPLVHHDDIAGALTALGFRPHDIQVIEAYQRAANIGPSHAIHEVGLGTGEDICRAQSLVSGLPYLPRSAAADLRLAALRFVAPNIGDDAQPDFVPIGLMHTPETVNVLFALADPSRMDAVRNHTYTQRVDNKKIKPAFCLASRIVIERLYRKEIRDSAADFDSALQLPADQGRYTLALKTLLLYACYQGASDIHFDPLPNAGVLRLRLDGILSVFRVLRRAGDRDDTESVFDRLLQLIGQDVNSKLDPKGLAEGALDTAVPPALAGKFQFRVELMATINGMGAVIRILDRSGDIADFENLGLDPATRTLLLRYAHTGSGLIIATGPTGSGKTTLINSVMRTIDAISTSVQTIENPVEVRVGTWRQHETKRLSGSDSESEEWMRWFRGMLRNDPDVVLLGEVRDADVARVAFDMANTGHLVFTTLHARTAALAVSRLREMRSTKTGERLDMDAAAALLLGIIAMRLVRRLCRDCRQKDERPTTIAAIQDRLEQEPKTLYRAREEGCPLCHHTGFRGRSMIYEVLNMTAEARDRVAASAPTREIAALLPKNATLWASGLRLVMTGVSSIDEIERIVNEDD